MIELGKKDIHSRARNLIISGVDPVTAGQMARREVARINTLNRVRSQDNPQEKEVNDEQSKDNKLNAKKPDVKGTS